MIEDTEKKKREIDSIREELYMRERETEVIDRCRDILLGTMEESCW